MDCTTQRKPLTGWGWKKSCSITLTFGKDIAWAKVCGRSCRTIWPLRSGYWVCSAAHWWPKPPPTSTKTGFWGSQVDVSSFTGYTSSHVGMPTLWAPMYLLKWLNFSGCCENHRNTGRLVLKVLLKTVWVLSERFSYFLSAKTHGRSWYWGPTVSKLWTLIVSYLVLLLGSYTQDSHQESMVYELGETAPL